MKTGTELITEERQRQISQEGWTPEHDDTHTKHELINAAIAYALTATGDGFSPGMFWPWQRQGTAKEGRSGSIVWEGFKSDLIPIRDLVKAGALIAAEIDRLQRLEAKRT